MTTPTELSRARFKTLRDIDDAAGDARLRYITDVAGQQVTYTAKLAQAHALIADPLSAPGAYIQAEATAFGVTPFARAQVVVATGDLWNEQLGPLIEGTRLQGKEQARAAGSLAALYSVRTAVVAALCAI